jgi:hypothetical protein
VDRQLGVLPPLLKLALASIAFGSRRRFPTVCLLFRIPFLLSFVCIFLQAVYATSIDSAKLFASGGAALTAAHQQISIFIGPAAGAYLVFPITILIVLLPTLAAIPKGFAL